MRRELGVIILADGIHQVFVFVKLHYTFSVVYVGITDLASLLQMILDVLP